MSDDGSFSVSFAAGLPAAEREALLTALRAHADEVQESPGKAQDWATVVVIME
jgi:hypothetical protein